MILVRHTPNYIFMYTMAFDVIYIIFIPRFSCIFISKIFRNSGGERFNKKKKNKQIDLIASMNGTVAERLTISFFSYFVALLMRNTHQ